MHPALRHFYYSSSRGGSTILLSEDFTGTSVDESKGAVTNPNAADLTISQNNKLIFTRTTDNAVTGPTANKWESVDSFPKGSVISVLMNRESGFTASPYFFRYVFNGTTAFISVQKESSGGNIRLAIQSGGGALEYDLNDSSGISPVNRIKIVTTTDNEISFWYWNTDQWTQIGTTQVVDLGASGKVSLSCESAIGDAPGHQFSFDQLRVTSEDYSTELPD